MMELQPFPRFSISERDRRWNVIRTLMLQEDLVAVVAPANTGHSTDFQANSRYISHCGGGGEADITVVFPLEGEVTVGSNGLQWLESQDWVTDVRNVHRDLGRVIIDRLHEVDVSGRRVGVTGLGAGTRTPEGTVLYRTMQRMLEEFPDVEFVDATPLLAEARVIKSEEEIAFLAKSNGIIDLAYEAEKAAAKVGALDYEVFAATMGALLQHGSELEVHTHWVSGQHPRNTLTRPTHRKLQRGDLIVNEVEASWAGYRAQGVQPVCVEQCDPAYDELLKVQREVWEQSFEMLVPGTPLEEVATACVKMCEEARPKSGLAAGCTAALTMHGRGQGDDGPIITPTAKESRDLTTVLAPNMVFIYKPSVTSADGSLRITWGDTVVIRKGRPERLGNRDHSIWRA